MIGTRVKVTKGLINSRCKGRPASKDRFAKLLQDYIEIPIAERLLLAQQWTELRNAGVQLCVIGEEYGVAMQTITTAIKDPKWWAEAPLRVCGAGRQLGTPKGTSTRSSTLQATRAKRSKALNKRSRMMQGCRRGGRYVGDPKR